MRTKHYWHVAVKEFEEIAGFGGATVVRDIHGRFHIQGGDQDDRKRAHDWMLRFMWPADQPKPDRWPGIIL